MERRPESRAALDARIDDVDLLLEELNPEEPQRQAPFGSLWKRIEVERDLTLEIRRGHLMDVEFVRLVDVDSATGEELDGIYVRRSLLKDVVRQLLALDRFLNGHAGSGASP